MRVTNYLLVAIFTCSVQSAMAQADATTRPAIEKAFAEDNTPLAGNLIQKAISYYIVQRNADSLNEYVFYAGKIAQLETNSEQAVKKVQALIQQIKSLSPPLVTLRQTWLEAAEYYGFAGKNKLAYEANQQAWASTLLMPDKTPMQQAIIQNNLGTYAQRMGDLNLSQTHLRQALQLYLSDPTPNFEKLYIVNNSMATVMWYASKLDSAVLFFNKAMQALEKTKPTIENKYYRPAIVQNNISGVYSVQGKTTEAIRAMKQSINNIRLFLASKEPSQKKNTAVSFQFEATDNLGGIYKDLGDYKQALELLTYSYQQKQKQLNADNPAIYISQILLGQIYYAMKEHDRAERFLQEGLQNISKADGDYLFWQGDACNTLALLYDTRKDTVKAVEFYEKADHFYEQSSQGEYDNIYLEFLNNAALFYAENHKTDKALAKANKGYQYILKTEGAESLLGFAQLLNLAEIHFVSGNYRQALTYSNNGLDVVNRIIHSSNNLLDSVRMELKKPKAILLKCKSEYELLPQKNITALNGILTNLNEALHILEKRKSILNDAKDISLLMADHTALLEFVKKVTLDLYHATGQSIYADQLVSLHESGIYSRIRSRLDKNGQMQFAHLPQNLQETEHKLKSSMTTALNSEGSHDQKMQAYLQSVENWNGFLEKLRKEQPRYYKMRYESIFNNTPQIQSQVPTGATVVRYFFAGNKLLALLADRDKKQLVELDTLQLEKRITSLLTTSTDVEKTGTLLYDLYRQLWEPLSKNIRYNKLVIIPDGILYHLNFELLTPQKISSFAELSTNSLLAKYAISYQYSLFLLEQKQDESPINSNFVAFAPGFSDQVKKKYLAVRGDSLEIDNGYLSLLPQPFTTSLATKAQKLLGGNTFMFDQSTLHSFKNNAGNHKIIHIGTHAESDDLHPEFSRLIFAKDPGAIGDSNSLYLFDIYNCDLRSNLTVLTACESGKPGYEDGEGMISLAHAFSYAGSESIITGLWKIDEQSSARLMDLFYQNLLKDMPRDEALRQAKLTYLSTANGRMLSPQYWAGLVLMGNTAPVDIKSPIQFTWIVASLIAVLAALFFFIRRKRK